MSNTNAREQALALFDAFEVEPTSLVSYRSGGKLLVLGDAAQLQNCDALAAAVDFDTLAVSSGRIDIQGHLGAYVIAVDGEQKRQADAVLDLGEIPLLSREMLPPGYFHFAPEDWNDVARVAELNEELEGLSGEFQKPRFFDYDPAICAHAVNGNIVCQQCIDACPAEAIHSNGDKIEVDPYLCQGGGSCTTVCPSGAIRYLYPTLRDNGKRLRSMLRGYAEQGGATPIVLFHAESFASDDFAGQHDNLLPFAVEELGSVGMDLCLSALAYGAVQVVLYADEETPVGTAANLRRQLDWACELVAALGFARDSIALCEAQAALPEIDPVSVTPAEFDMPQGKRQAILQALDHLVAQQRPTAEHVELPVPAPFGAALIDSEACTLCLACVSACPGRALQDGSNREVPEVFFIENNCLQCGACVQTCPEDAIGLAPRLMFDRDQRVRSRVLNRDKPFACIACGKPFAPSSVIDKMLDKLKDHHMFTNQRALDRLKMCDDCRVVDIVQDPEALGGQFDPLKNFRQ